MKMPCAPEKNVCSALVGWSVLQMLVRLIELIVLPRFSNPMDYPMDILWIILWIILSTEHCEYCELYRITVSNTE